MAVGDWQRSINIFYVGQTITNDGMIVEENRESISFQSYMVLVYNQL